MTKTSRKVGNVGPDVAWREGRPRFMPSSVQRAEGWTGLDLKHPDGRWFAFEEARAWALARREEIIARRAAGDRAPDRTVAPKAGSIDSIFQDFMGSLWMRGDPDAGFRPKSAATITDYQKKYASLLAFAPDIASSHVRALTKPIVLALVDKALRARPAVRGKGRKPKKITLNTAKGMVTVLSLVCSHAERLGLRPANSNPCWNLELPERRPRLVLWDDFEIRALVAAADHLGFAPLGDGVFLALFTGQRQGDRLTLQDGGRDAAGRLLIVQSKTGAMVAIPEAPDLKRRLEAMRVRRAVRGVLANSPLLIADETDRETVAVPVNGDWYRHRFWAARLLAAKGFVDALGVRHLPCPTLIRKRDQDLRDTAVTWLAMAGCEIGEICSITGHSIKSAHEIMRHYLVLHPEMADTAIGKLVVWMEKTGRKVA